MRQHATRRKIAQCRGDWLRKRWWKQQTARLRRREWKRLRTEEASGQVRELIRGYTL